MQNNFPTILKKFDKDTKFIVHGAEIHQGSSETLFDKDGHIRLNVISDTVKILQFLQIVLRIF